MTDAKPQPESQAARLIRQCLCGCGNIPKQPKSVFWPGHDMRVKGMLSRLENAPAEEKFRLPDALVARATIDPTLRVHGYDSEKILRLAALDHSEAEADRFVLP